MTLRSRNKISPNFNMSSMTDIVFLLLVFFMLTSTLVSPNALKLLLPNSKAKTLEKQTISVSITKDIDFYINDENVFKRKGLYSFSNNNEIKYIGRCRTNYRDRINNGYGRIAPRNCYIGGQSTNCRINHLFTQERDQIEFFVLPMEDITKIETLEKKLIKESEKGTFLYRLFGRKTMTARFGGIIEKYYSKI